MRFGRATAVCALLVLPSIGLVGQAPPLVPPLELDRLVQRIALYPDALLAQVLAASTYYDQIPDAARWAMAHRNLHGQVLADTITSSQVPWDPSVQALLPLPTVLDMMARDMNWTARLGSAFLAQPNDVMDATQRDRRIAYEYGYLRPSRQLLVSNGRFIVIAPVSPSLIYVPIYDPMVVFVRPRPGFYMGGAITFGFSIGIGAWFRPWGWGVAHFGWGHHVMYVNNAAWGRTWTNRESYVHPYLSPNVPHPGPSGRPVNDRPPSARSAPAPPANARQAPAQHPAAKNVPPKKEDHHP